MECLEGGTDAPPVFEDDYGFAFRRRPNNDPPQPTDVTWWRGRWETVATVMKRRRLAQFLERQVWRS